MCFNRKYLPIVMMAALWVAGTFVVFYVAPIWFGPASPPVWDPDHPLPPTNVDPEKDWGKLLQAITTIVSFVCFIMMPIGIFGCTHDLIQEGRPRFWVKRITYLREGLTEAETRLAELTQQSNLPDAS